MGLGRVALFLVLAIIPFTTAYSNECQKFVEKLIQNIMQLNIKQIPKPSIMYSGITTNNPGQKQQCETANYTYFLVSFKNVTYDISTFTGLCIPSQCQREDIQIALQGYNCKVYDYPMEADVDGLAVAGYVIVGLWLGIVVVWSIISSCRGDDQGNEYIRKEEKEESVNMLGQNKEQHHHEDHHKLFNFYEGYNKIFRHPRKKNIMGPVLFLSVLSILVATEFSYRQTVAANEFTTFTMLDSVLGLFIGNIEIALSTIMFILGLKLSYSVYKSTSFHQIGRFLFDAILKKWVGLILLSLLVYVVMSWLSPPLDKIWKINNGQDCKAYMWQMWFLFRNLQMDCKVCLPWFWLLQADLLLTIFSTPFIIIYRSKKPLGYLLLTLLILTSLVVSYAILDDEGIVFQPYKLFNQPKEFTINYQASTVVRIAPYFLGVIFGLILIEGLQKTEGSKKVEYKLAKRVRRAGAFNYLLQGAGLALMALCFLLLQPHLSLADPKADQTVTYLYLIFSPILFLLGLSCFVLPSFWQADTALTHLINSILGWSFWIHLDKIAISLYLLGPAVIGFTTYSMQNSIYFDFQTVFTYFLGDIVISYIFALVIVSAIDHQLGFAIDWMQGKLFGNENKYSVLVIQD